MTTLNQMIDEKTQEFEKRCKQGYFDMFMFIDGQGILDWKKIYPYFQASLYESYSFGKKEWVDEIIPIIKDQVSTIDDIIYGLENMPEIKTDGRIGCLKTLAEGIKRSLLSLLKDSEGNSK